MGLLSTIAPAAGTCVVGVVTTLATAEFSACAPTWARRIVRRAARGLPEEERAASEAEWLAHVEDVPGNLSKLLQACGLWRMMILRKIDLSAKLHSLKNPVIVEKYIIRASYLVALLDTLTFMVYLRRVFVKSNDTSDNILGTLCMFSAVCVVVVIRYIVKVKLLRVREMGKR